MLNFGIDRINLLISNDITVLGNKHISAIEGVRGMFSPTP